MRIGHLVSKATGYVRNKIAPRVTPKAKQAVSRLLQHDFRTVVTIAHISNLQQHKEWQDLRAAIVNAVEEFPKEEGFSVKELRAFTCYETSASPDEKIFGNPLRNFHSVITDITLTRYGFIVKGKYQYTGNGDIVKEIESADPDCDITPYGIIEDFHTLVFDRIRRGFNIPYEVSGAYFASPLLTDIVSNKEKKSFLRIDKEKNEIVFNFAFHYPKLADCLTEMDRKIDGLKEQLRREHNISL